MKVVIADDEHLVRFGLKSMIEELNLGLQVVAEAATGDELVAAVAKHQPELCFVDIRMPGLNGLTAIRKARRAGSRARWIILTSHAEFDYASEALQLGVSAYLLKPAGPANLEEVLTPLIKAVEKERREKSVRFEHALVAALGAPGSRLSQVPLVEAAWVLLVKGDAGADVSSADRAEFPAEVLRQCRALASAATEGGLTTAAWLDGDGVLVTAAWEPGDADARNAAAKLKEAVGIAVKQAAGSARRLTAFAAEVTGWDDFQAVLADLTAVSPQRVLFGVGVVHALGALKRRVETLSPALRALACHVEEFLRTRDRGEVPALETQAQAIRDAFAAAGPAAAFLETAARYLAFRTGLEPPPAGGSAVLVPWADQLVEATRTELPDLRRAADAQTRVVEKVDQYLRLNLRSEVRVPDIASALGLTPNYLSFLYHKLTKNTISERLTVLRLELSRDLLARPGSQVKDVAATVGYKSPRYFARLYHKRFGHYPSGR